MAYTEQQTSSGIADLLGGLVTDITGLFRKEVELARVEASEKIDDAVGAVRNLAAGLVLATGAFGVFLAALVGFGTAVLDQTGMPTAVSVAISALVIAIVVGLIAWAAISSGMNEFKASKLNMQRTAESLQKDAAAVRENL